MLGFIVAPLGKEVPGQYPSEIQYSYDGNRSYLGPFDPQFNTSGEAGLYYDTALGGIPTDAELATAYQYTPVASAWINAKEGFFPAPWRTPGGWSPAGAYGPKMSLSGAGLTSVVGDYKLWGVLAAGVGAFFLTRKLLKK
jgi:hypothetical protein